MIINGTDYNIAKLATQYKLSKCAVINRIIKSIPLDADTKYLRKHAAQIRPRNIEVMFRGEMRSLDYVAEQMGYSRATAYQRKVKGIPFEATTDDLKKQFSDRLKTPGFCQNMCRIKIDIDGSELTVAQVAAKLDISNKGVRDRYHKGLPMVKATKLYIETEQGDKTIAEYAEMHKLSRQAVYNRVHQNKVTTKYK